jgi:amino acid adenylation domain-containing protein
MDRSLEMMVGLIGIMKSGAAYLPLDPAFPEDRIGFMIKDSAAPLILTRKNLVPALGNHDAEIVCIDADYETIRQFPTTCLKEDPEAENLSYVIYTSGSTGLPKGVKISNRALMNFLCSMRKAPGLEPSDVVLAETTLSFDIAGLELFLPLITGAGIALVDKETGYDGILMQQAIDRYGVTVMQATPATWRILLESGWQGSSRLKALCGGEALPRELAALLLTRCKELWNMYGPTETTIWSTVSRIESADEPILIGRPIANTTIYILDENLHPVPIGVPGELHIGGDGLAGGYLNREELSSEKFIASPFSSESDTRIYKTGDLARYKADGRIECLGRLDHQVKIHGFRIELGEIEARLSENPAVRKNVIMAREDSPGEKYLAAYIVPESGMETSIQELQRYLHGFLPDYMVPAAFEILDELPLTPNGKIDRRALPVPRGFRRNREIVFEAPRTPLEETIAGIWEEVLGAANIGIRDSFFSLGGHSLLATRVVAKLSASDFALEVPVRYIFEYPTISDLADAVMLDMMSAEEDASMAEMLDAIGVNAN